MTLTEFILLSSAFFPHFHFRSWFLMKENMFTGIDDEECVKFDADPSKKSGSSELNLVSQGDCCTLSCILVI